ncbi:hypothetical protein CYMTET_19029 [Cymbomonas tetramitiformis]|uniref:Uncharacterized protein n=1 Tax=Cymbomonas tetramitiformis TaxID=36881 RepID=A0AAE0CAX9_9CHLO|nr:hypothetical protein CYMTET_39002 [Cymbomonas tetramitiformis]KAK3251668.1 hypothetical protein CYMTET_38997 [Cymbomonas tetramitiformis]KAK3272691.1 hypothetical protein CYMTET_19029 [Cymbomonas tetramitiformis]
MGRSRGARTILSSSEGNGACSRAFASPFYRAPGLSLSGGARRRHKVKQAIADYAYANGITRDRSLYPHSISADYSTDRHEKSLTLGAFVRAFVLYGSRVRFRNLVQSTLHNGKTNAAIEHELNKVAHDVGFDSGRAEPVFAVGSESRQKAAALRLLYQRQFAHEDVKSDTG